MKSQCWLPHRVCYSGGVAYLSSGTPFAYHLSTASMIQQPNDQQQRLLQTRPGAGSPTKDFPIVCVGGSAGGLDAYIRLLQNLPADMGVAIVIVNHITLMPTHLHEVLPRFTTMPVELITESLLIEPDRVFIIPENRDLHVRNGEFRLEPISKPRGWPDV